MPTQHAPTPYAAADTAVTRRLRDLNSHDRAKTVRLCQVLAWAILLLGIAFPIMQVFGIATMLGRQPGPGLFGILALVCTIALAIASILFWIGRAIYDGSIFAVWIITLVASLGALASLGLAAIILLAGGELGGVGFLSEGLAIAGTFTLLASLQGILAYHGLRVLIYRGSVGPAAIPGTDIRTLAAAWCARRDPVRVLRGTGMTLLAGSALYALSAAIALGATLLKLTPNHPSLSTPFAPAALLVDAVLGILLAHMMLQGRRKPGDTTLSRNAALVLFLSPVAWAVFFFFWYKARHDEDHPVAWFVLAAALVLSKIITKGVATRFGNGDPPPPALAGAAQPPAPNEPRDPIPPHRRSPPAARPQGR